MSKLQAVAEEAFNIFFKIAQKEGDYEEAAEGFNEAMESGLEDTGISVDSGWILDIPGDELYSVISTLVALAQAKESEELSSVFHTLLEGKLCDVEDSGETSDEDLEKLRQVIAVLDHQ